MNADFTHRFRVMSLRSRIALFTAVFALVLALLVTQYWGRKAELLGVSMLDQGQQKMVDQLADTIAPLMLKNNLTAVLQSLNTSCRRHRDEWLYLQLEDAAGHRLFPVSRQLEPPSGLLMISKEVSFLDEKLGQLVVGVDTGAGREKILDITQRLTAFLVYMILLNAVALLLLVHTTVLSPLKKIRQGMDAVSQGDYDTPLPSASSQEVSDLVLGFAEMRTRLREHESVLLQAKQDAESANAAKSRFLSNMSHELRTPLNAIMGYAQLFRMDDSLDSTLQEWNQEILAASDHLLAMIAEILDLSAIESGVIKPHIGEFNVERLVSESCAIVEPVFNEHGVSLIRPAAMPEHYFNSDMLRIKQIVINLLSNAAKYSGSGSIVNFDVGLDNDRLRLVVEDNGVGIAPESQQLLFLPFERLGVESKGIQGSGIGLFLTRKLVHLLGGELRFFSSPGKGCCFTVVLPAMTAMEVDGA